MIPEPQSSARLTVANRRRGGWPLTLLRTLCIGATVACLGAGVGVGALYTYFARDLPRLDDFDSLVRPGVTRFEAADGQLVGEWSQQRRIQLRWDELPRNLVLAFLAAEDSRFFSHSGVDLKGVVRAMITNLQAGSIQQGASTITQQLAKTLVGNERSYARKVREAILARRLEDLYSKQQILTWYLNAIFLGHGSYGVQAAAQNYFRKDAWDLNLAEMAILGGTPQSPSLVNPAKNLSAARERMAHVLLNMRRNGWIDEAQQQAALATTLKVYPIQDRLGDHIPQYTEHVRKQVATSYGKTQTGRPWLDHGLTVSMAVESAHQREASEALSEGLEDLARRQGYPGPLARLDREVFFERTARYLADDGVRVGRRLLARVTRVTDQSAVCELGPKTRGYIPLSTTKWAGRYKGFPKDRKGRVKRDGKASFKPRLKDMRKAFKVGDVLLVEVDSVGAERTQLRLVPIPLMEGALVSYPTITGGVEAMVGAWDFDRSQVNRAFAVRQTGSTMKPIVYGKAYDLGLRPSELFSGAPFREGRYNPTGARTKKDMLVWNALSRSENAVSLRVLRWVLDHTPLKDYQAWGEALGLPRPLQGNISEVLGGDQTAFGMAHAFGVFALRGVEPAMHLIRKISDRDGKVLERHIEPSDPYASFGDTILALWDDDLDPRQRILKEETAYLVTANLRQAVERGTAKRAKSLHQSVAGKTGTLPYDVWFDGFSNERVAVAWIGADRRERPLGLSVKVNKVYGADTALPVFVSFMERMDRGRPSLAVDEKPPKAIRHLRIDPDTGLLATEGGQAIPHRKGFEPTEFSFEPGGSQNIHEAETEF
ncbi:MAG: penicillin-binding protein 1A [Myxococcota bacterium]